MRTTIVSVELLTKKDTLALDVFQPQPHGGRTITPPDKKPGHRTRQDGAMADSRTGHSDQLPHPPLTVQTKFLFSNSKPSSSRAWVSWMAPHLIKPETGIPQIPSASSSYQSSASSSVCSCPLILQYLILSKPQFPYL